MAKHIGILTSGGDCPGLNAAIRRIAKAGMSNYSYDLEAVSEAIRNRGRAGKHFSIVAVAEGAMTNEQAGTIQSLLQRKDRASKKEEMAAVSRKLSKFHAEHVRHTQDLTRSVEELTSYETRLTILGHVQLGGTPSPVDRVLATRLGTACATFLAEGGHGAMMAAQGTKIVPVPLEEVAGRKNLVPLDHPLVESARLVGTSLGD